MKKVVLITGCSSGIGRELALECATTCYVIATVRNEVSYNSLLDKSIKLELNLDIQYCDVNSSSDIEKLMAYIASNYTKLDCLINNAGIALGGFFEDCSLEQIQGVMNTNVLGLMTVTKQALPLLHLSENAKIINMSSIAGRLSSPTISIYNASKWAVEGFSEALLFELKPFNIDVVLVEPGQYRTKIFTDNLVIATESENPQSKYQVFSKRAFTKLKSKIEKVLKDPKNVAELCHEIVHKKRPRFRYMIGIDAKIRLIIRQVLPFFLYRKLVNFICARVLFKK